MKLASWIIIMFGIVLGGCSNMHLQSNTKHTVVLEKYAQGYKVQVNKNNKSEDEIFSIDKTSNKPKPKKLPIKPITATPSSSGYISTGSDCQKEALRYCYDISRERDGTIDSRSFRICYDSTMAFICSKEGRHDAGFDRFIR